MYTHTHTCMFKNVEIVCLCHRVDVDVRGPIHKLCSLCLLPCLSQSFFAICHCLPAYTTLAYLMFSSDSTLCHYSTNHWNTGLLFSGILKDLGESNLSFLVSKKSPFTKSGILTKASFPQRLEESSCLLKRESFLALAGWTCESGTFGTCLGHR